MELRQEIRTMGELARGLAVSAALVVALAAREVLWPGSGRVKEAG